MQSSKGSLQWTEGAISVTDAVTDKLRLGIQLHMYQMGSFGGPNMVVDWASGDYKVNDHFGIRAGRSRLHSARSMIRRMSTRCICGRCCLK